MPVGAAIDSLLLISEASEPDEFTAIETLSDNLNRCSYRTVNARLSTS
jgi:hypothetical protein